MTSDFGADIFDEEPSVSEPPPRAAPDSSGGADKIEEVRLRSTPSRHPETERDLVFTETAPEPEPSPPAARREPERPRQEHPVQERPRQEHPVQEREDEEERRPERRQERHRDRGRAGGGRGRRERHGRDRDRSGRRPPPAERPPSEERPPREDRAEEPRAERREPRRETSEREGSEREGSLTRWTPSPAAPADRRPTAEEGQRSALLIDYAGLQESAHRLGGEISFRRLLKQLAGGRPLIRSVCYVPKGTPEAVVGPMRATGFEVFEVEDSATATVAAAVDGMALAPRVDCVVLAPGSSTMAPLARALSATGVRVETASFEGASTMPGQHRRLGRNCVFVP